ncbi:MAG TPA: response regulator transcription factor [Bacteroidota bacterium]
MMQRDDLKFLIVDDNPSMRQTIGRIIRREGDEIFECDDGKDAAAMYRQHRPDWVFMDINMKEVGGIEATGQILEEDSHARVVVVTDYGDKFFRKAATDAGASAFVSKENIFELKSIIGRAS